MVYSIPASAPQISLEQFQEEIAHLSEQEKAKAYADVYGKAQPIAETPELINEALRELQEHMDFLPMSQKKQFSNAMERCHDHANDPRFRLMFLRAEEFNVEKAAQRMALYWEKKVEVFGRDKAFHRLTLADFDQEDQEALRKGGVRFLPKKDKAGRGIMTANRTRYELRPSHRKSMMRQVWYVHHAAMEDESVQKHGIVYVAEFPGTKTTLAEQDRKLDAVFLKHLRLALPIRVVGVHHYFNIKLFQIFIPIMLSLLGPDLRARYRTYSGTHEQWSKALDGYGVAMDIIPADFGGSSDFSYEDWLNDRAERGL